MLRLCPLFLLLQPSVTVDVVDMEEGCLFPRAMLKRGALTLRYMPLPLRMYQSSAPECQRLLHSPGEESA
jgi:hypothetical protein